VWWCGREVVVGTDAEALSGTAVAEWEAKVRGTRGLLELRQKLAAAERQRLEAEREAEAALARAAEERRLAAARREEEGRQRKEAERAAEAAKREAERLEALRLIARREEAIRVTERERQAALRHETRERERVEQSRRLQEEILQSAERALAGAWVNSLGMKFVPVAGTEVLFSIWETRVQDYAAYAAASERERVPAQPGKRGFWANLFGSKEVQLSGSGVDGSWQTPGFQQAPTHPVVNVSWEDAQAFCAWLTEKERSMGKLTREQNYRLTADWEWSVAVGLNEARGGTPKDKDAKIKGVYPWGTQWPPPRGAGNFADTSSKAKIPSLSIIEGYRDGYATTSPVGSFVANPFGLYDLSGNVWEWCEDCFDGRSGSRVVRGGSWGASNADGLLSSSRSNAAPVNRDRLIGFRVVLVGGLGSAGS
ncbi:MAG: SUMF1/EgtB/PvdO family nonheme iron enzyme, partial [Limisphaerales bacterium]